MRVVWAWLSCLALVAAEKGIHNMINVGDDNVPFDSCGVTVAYTENSRLDIFVLGMDDQIWHRDQPNYTSPGDEWNPWASLGGAFKDGPVVTRGPEGRLMVFSRGFNNAVFFRSQIKANAGPTEWGPWESLSGELYSKPAVAVDSEGTVHVFGKGKDNTVLHRYQSANASGIYWGEWENLGSSLSGAPSVIVDAEGLMHVFGRSTDRSLFHLYQLPEPGVLRWGNWKTMGGTLASQPRLATLNSDSNLLEVVVRGPDKSYWVKAQVKTLDDNVMWSSWGTLGGVFASAPSTIVNHDGMIDVFGRGVDQRVYGKHQYMTEEGTAFTPWTDYGGAASSAIEVGRRPDGTIALFTRTANKMIALKYQLQNSTDFSLSWSEWMSLEGLTRTFTC